MLKANTTYYMIKPAYPGRIILLAAILILGTFAFTGTGCRLLKRDKQAMAEKKTAEADKKADAEYEKARKRHYKRQSKEAKKMMKKTKKQAAKFNKPLKRKGSSKPKCS
jgi:type VI protein secretion system component VasK